MKNLFHNIYSSQCLGARLVLLTYALGFPLALIGHYTHTFDLYSWLALAPTLVWQGQVWRLFTYALLPGGWVDWAVSLFWLATLISVLGRNWTSRGFAGYCLLGIIAGALPVVLLKAGAEFFYAGNAAMIFALLAAWDWFYRRERLILLGFGEISARQAALFIALINSLILFFCCGWFLMLAMWCGGVALKLIQKAVELNPSNFLLWLEQGHCQQAIGLVSAAETSFTQARQLNPHSEAVNAALHQLSQVGFLSRLFGKCRGLFRR